jgi:hypothetical protein
MKKIILLLSTISLLGCSNPENAWVCSCKQMDEITENLNVLSRQMNHSVLSDTKQRDTILCLYQEQVMKTCKFKPVVSLDSCEQVMYNM